MEGLKINKLKKVIIIIAFIVLIFTIGQIYERKHCVKENIILDDNTNIINCDKREYFPNYHHNIDFEIKMTNETNGILINDVIYWSELKNGKSMNPTIFKGNTLLLEKYNGQNLTEGEIIVFKVSEDENFIHRIVGITPKYYITQGDNNNFKEVVYANEIKSIVVGVLYT